VSEVGYNSESYRGWSTSALSHNLVVVDGATQCGNPWDGMHEPDKAIGGQIVSWFPQQDGFGVVEAESRNCYPQCSVYRRMKMRCPDGLGLKGNGAKQEWRETYFPLRTFRGPLRIKVPRRAKGELAGRE